MNPLTLTISDKEWSESDRELLTEVLKNVARSLHPFCSFHVEVPLETKP